MSEVSWPVQLSKGDLAGLVSSLGLYVAPASPLADLLNETVESSVDGEGGVVLPPAPVVRGVKLACNPRQLILIRLKAGTGDPEDTLVLGFLSDGELLVRFDVGASGCTLAEPCTPNEFAQLVCSLTGVEAATSNRETVAIVQGFLEVVVALRSAGLFEGDDACISRSAAGEAISAASRGEGRVDERLRALEADGMLVAGGSLVRPCAAWMSEWPFLCAPAGATLEGIELLDRLAGRGIRKRLAVLGATPEGILYLPAAVGAPGREVILDLEGATPTNLIGAVERLLAPPLSPPCEPVTECAGEIASWLEADADATISAEWSVQSFEDIFAPLDDASPVPAALMRPQATVEVASIASGGTQTQRTIFALGDVGAVEWTLDGSLVRWRSLDPGTVSTRLRELIPASPGGGGQGVGLELPAGALEALMEGSSTALASLVMPAAMEPLRALASDPRVRWHKIRAGTWKLGARHNATMLIASSSTSGLWRFDLDDEAVTMRGVGPDHVRAELAAALAVALQPIPAVDSAGRG